ncbi:dethiobiotin synthetase [Rhodococcus rhodochrous J3]|uniref:ATP-dependent dethiobiotin synthetase BioD n=2 Tax=Rhodococcus rhodochrous TaxID=1829 RepID=A0AA46WSD6_RHORH|nr:MULTISPECIES: dethiobiotin synthase [Rhodococcus]AYA26806.1 ATP-dependent dethiobiotin synthetase BioD [Rhodococcus rhodochrous]MBF4477010.1 ATP-dependent dethiobiotin synthetase BioD [Rhodococcus rhodochrous]MCB8908862.1 dethiobiotin synthase [Rhodococcus rhodochrous]MCD2096061.1 dethiobiotin synthase [Rhodococcus rhodochrous]MCD2120819.1 dethiobiotin synthase [Rhodococcus rhodochrous]
MSVLVVTGTSTDVGKTVATAALAVNAVTAGLRVAVCKPAQTGVTDDGPGDLHEILRLTGDSVRVVELARYPDPLAPDTAARRSGRPPLTLDEIIDTVRRLDAEHDLTLVEGAGGLLVRLGAGGFTLADVAAALGAPAVIVAAAGLGTLNHTALTVAALRAAGVECPGVIIGSWPAAPDLAEQCNLDDLPDVTGVPVVGRIPAGSGALDAHSFAARASRWSDLPPPAPAATYA